MGAQEAAAFIQKIRPNIAIPMHFYDNEETLSIFLRSFQRVRKLSTHQIYVTRKTLPPPTEIWVLKHP